nr:hypothetical protein [Candidatus Cloacimonadota bacterium]
MAKILSLRLNYKGKFLDYAKEGKEIKKKFIIGQNKNLQWQILDPSFPDKFQLIKQKGRQYVMQLPPGSELSCEIDGKPLDSEYLKQNHLLSGNELVLNKDMKGTLTVSKDWSIDFDFREPWVAVLTDEERAIVAQYARRSKPDAISRFNRTVVWIVLLLTVAFILLFDQVLKPEYTFEETIQERLQNIQSAQRVIPEIVSPQPSFAQPLDNTPEQTEADATDSQVTTGTGPRGSAGLTRTLQGFDASATGTAPALTIATVTEGFTANRPGSRPGNGISTGRGTVAGIATGTAYNPAATPVFEDIGSVVTSGPQTGGYSVRPEGASGIHITGDASSLAPSGQSWGDVVEQQRIAADFARRGISTVNESSITTLDEDTRTKYTSLREQIESRQSQIEHAYREMQIRQNVSFTITLFIRADGTVKESQVIPNGSYPEAFVAKVKSIVDSWKFNVREEMAYQFRIRAG